MSLKGSPDQLAQRRRQVMELLKQGYRGKQVAQIVGITPIVLSRWKKLYQQQGEAFYQVRRPPGKPAKLSAQQIRRLDRWLGQGARKHGYPNDLWTLRRIANLIEKRFGIRYDPSGVWYLLKRMGYSCQKPQRRARQHDPQAALHWRQTIWPTLKKSPSDG